MKKISAMFLLAALAMTGCDFNGSPSQGEKVGQVVKVAQQGLLNRTYEAELIRGGISNGSGAMGKPFDFTIRSDSDAKALSQAMEEQAEVSVKYDCPFVYGVFETHSGCFMTSFSRKEANHQ